MHQEQADEANLIRDVSMSFLPINAILGLFGIVTNVLNLFVFCRQTLKDSVTVCFIALAIVDLTTVTSTLIYVLLFWNEAKMGFFEFLGLTYVGKSLLFSRHFQESINRSRIIKEV